MSTPTINAATLLNKTRRILNRHGMPAVDAAYAAREFVSNAGWSLASSDAQVPVIDIPVDVARTYADKQFEPDIVTEIFNAIKGDLVP